MMLRKSFALLIYLLVSIQSFATCPVVDDSESAQFGLQTGGIQAARQLLNNLTGDWRSLCSLKPVDLAKVLNAVVYHFCSKPKDNVPLKHLNHLFRECHTACGGRSYVLKGLLAVYGIHAQYRNIYNIPIQGNHSALEVDINGATSFFDPTFGAFFTKHAVEDRPLSLDEIRFIYDEHALAEHVYQAKKFHLKPMIQRPVNQMYSKGFNSNLFRLAFYINHETSEPLNPDKILFLSANIELKQNTYTLGCLSAKNTEEASACFLKETNALYNSANPKHHLSYNFNNLGFLNGQMKMNAFNINGLQRSAVYQLTLLLNNQTGHAVALHLSPLQNGLVLAPGFDQVLVNPGIATYSVHFKANDRHGKLLLYLSPKTQEFLNLFGFSVTKMHG